MSEHMPGCGALTCYECNHPVRYACHSGGQFAIARNGKYIPPHDVVPGTCNCELGRLRAEVERLKVYEQLSWEVNDAHEETIEVPKAEDLVKEIIRLRARVAELESQLSSIVDAIKSSRKGSIGSYQNTYICQIGVDWLENIISEAGD